MSSLFLLSVPSTLLLPPLVGVILVGKLEIFPSNTGGCLEASNNLLANDALAVCLEELAQAGGLVVLLRERFPSSILATMALTEGLVFTFLRLEERQSV